MAEENKERENAVDKEQSEEAPEKPTEGEPEKIKATAETPGANFFSPEIIMFLPAVLLDVTSLILLFFALDDFFITDIVGILIIGGWIFFRSQTVPVTKKVAQKMGKAGKWGKRMKWLRPLLISGELIPYVGALPCWTLLVFLELKN